MSDLKEFDVGMTEYLTTQKGLGGIIKLRIEDFVVNEITQAKEKVHLTDLSTVLNSMKESQVWYILLSLVVLNAITVRLLLKKCKIASLQTTFSIISARLVF